MTYLIISESKFSLPYIKHHIKSDHYMHREAGSVILKITYGYTAEAHGRDPFVDLAGATMKGFAEATIPGKWIVDILPFSKCAQAEPHNTSNSYK